MSVILVTGSYDHEIRFWEAWSGICSRTIARSGESGVSSLFNRAIQIRSRFVSRLASEPSRYLSRVTHLFSSCGDFVHVPPLSKRLLAAAIHKKVYIYEIASTSSTPVGFLRLCSPGIEVCKSVVDLSRWTHHKCYLRFISQRRKMVG